MELTIPMEVPNGEAFLSWLVGVDFLGPSLTYLGSVLGTTQVYVYG